MKNLLSSVREFYSSRNYFIMIIIACIIIIGPANILKVSAQPEVMAWGNITGIRVEGQLMELESSLRIVLAGAGLKCHGVSGTRKKT